MLNTRVEANIISYELTKKLRCLILSIENLKLKAVSSQVLQFIGIVKAKVRIKYRIRYTTIFFLVQELKEQTLLIVLLRQSFIQAIKIIFKYRNYSSIDTIFYNLYNYSIYTILVIPLVKRIIYSKYYQQAFIKNRSSKRENQLLVLFPRIILVSRRKTKNYLKNLGLIIKYSIILE